MMFIPSKYQAQVLLLVLTLMFGGYGLQEVREASADGSSLDDGIEALAMAAVVFTIFVVVTWVKRRRTRHEEHFDAR